MSPRRSYCLSVPLVLLLALSFSSAQAAVIPETEVLTKERIDDTLVGVNSLNQGLIVIHQETGGDPIKLTSKTRAGDGSLGPQENISSTANATIPRQINFDNTGGAFLTWGVATVAAKGEFTNRLLGASFLSPTTYTTPPCTTYQSAANRLDGGVFVACSANSGSAPNDDVILISNNTSFTSTSFTTPVLAQATTNDDYISPKIDSGPNGNAAVAWTTSTPTTPPANLSRIRALLNTGTWRGTQTLASFTSSVDVISGADVAVMADGRAIVLWGEYKTTTESYGKLNLGVINSDGTIGATETVANSPTEGFSVARDGDGVLIAWSQNNGSLGNPFISKVVHYKPSAGFSAPQTLDSGTVATVVGDIVTGADGTVAIPRRNGASFGAYVRRAGQTSFSDLEMIKDYGAALPAGQTVQDSSLAIDNQGDIFASWVLSDSDGTDPDFVYWGGLDFNKPTVSSLTVPASLAIGEAGNFAATASDTSGMQSIGWDFGDGQTATGASASHSYATAGSYTVKLTATDRAGNQREETRLLTVPTGPSPEPTINIGKFKTKVAKRSVKLTTPITISLAGQVSQRVTTKRGKKITTRCLVKKTLAAGNHTLVCTMGNSLRRELRRRKLTLTVTTGYTPNAKSALVKTGQVKLKRRR